MLISIQKMIAPLWSAVASEARHPFSVPGLMTCLAKPEAPEGRHIPIQKRRRRCALPSHPKNSKRDRLVFAAGKSAVMREAGALGQGDRLVELLPDTARLVGVRAERQPHADPGRHLQQRG